jgi:predicted O-methyltransferase YrrM
VGKKNDIIFPISAKAERAEHASYMSFKKDEPLDITMMTKPASPRFRWKQMAQIIALTLLNIIKGRGDFLIKVLTRSHVKKPWMHYKEMMIISEILRRKKPKTCLEWGSGYSTAYFPKNLEKDSLWVSIEDNREWYEKIKPIISRPNTKIYCVPANSHYQPDVYTGDAHSDFKDYVEFPQSLGMKFDFILIDGKVRKDCLLCALDILNKEGTVVLHNANRKDYSEALRHYTHQVLFNEDSLYSGLWIGNNDLNLQAVFDVEKYKKLWEFHKKLLSIKNRILFRNNS